MFSVPLSLSSSSFFFSSPRSSSPRSEAEKSTGFAAFSSFFIKKRAPIPAKIVGELLAFSLCSPLPGNSHGDLPALIEEVARRPTSDPQGVRGHHDLSSLLWGIQQRVKDNFFPPLITGCKASFFSPGVRARRRPPLPLRFFPLKIPRFLRNINESSPPEGISGSTILLSLPQERCHI